jgi:predicted HTH transcriptional regulator
MGKLNDQDIIKNFIITGETKTVEFKETLRLNLHTKEKDENLEKAVLKNIVAFLNTEGGYLLIGINDDGKIVGVEDEIKKLFKNKSDKYKLHLNNLIRDRIGKDFFQYIDYKLVKVEDLNVLMIKCKRSKKACYLNGNDFYVRTNPSANKLDGPELVDYVNNHFGEK